MESRKRDEKRRREVAEINNLYGVDYVLSYATYGALGAKKDALCTSHVVQIWTSYSPLNGDRLRKKEKETVSRKTGPCANGPS